MRAGELFEHRQTATAEPPEATMDVHVVHQCIGRAYVVTPTPIGTSTDQPSTLKPTASPSITIAARRGTRRWPEPAR
ncbi:MAG: hypothetical protein R2713_11385 [Ilumatobacteraceae bacterium]